MNGMRWHRLSTVLRAGVAIIALGIAGVAFVGVARPMPRMIIRSRTG
jgi:O-antigen ligase